MARDLRAEIGERFPVSNSNPAYSPDGPIEDVSPMRTSVYVRSFSIDEKLDLDEGEAPVSMVLAQGVVYVLIEVETP